MQMAQPEAEAMGRHMAMKPAAWEMVAPRRRGMLRAGAALLGLCPALLILAFHVAGRDAVGLNLHTAFAPARAEVDASAVGGHARQLKEKEKDKEGTDGKAPDSKKGGKSKDSKEGTDGKAPDSKKGGKSKDSKGKWVMAYYNYTAKDNTTMSVKAGQYLYHFGKFDSNKGWTWVTNQAKDKKKKATSGWVPDWVLEKPTVKASDYANATDAGANPKAPPSTSGGSDKSTEAKAAKDAAKAQEVETDAGDSKASKAKAASGKAEKEDE